MTLKISTQLWLGFGLLILILVVTGLVTVWQVNLVTADLTTITARAEPTSAAAYQMSNRAAATGLEVYNYLSANPPAQRAAVAREQAGFEEAQNRYHALLDSPASRELARQVGALSGQYKLLGQNLLDGKDRQEALFVRASGSFRQLGETLVLQLRGNTDLQAPDAGLKIDLTRALEADNASIIALLGDYLRTHQRERREGIFERAASFRETLDRFCALDLDEAEGQRAREVKRLLDEHMATVVQVVTVHDAMRTALRDFSRVRTELERLLSDQVQAGSQRRLRRAEDSARKVATRLRALVTCMLGAGVLLGSTAAALIATGIIGRIRRLIRGAEQLGAGEFAHRIEPGSADEIGALAAAFNQMAERRQRAEAARRESDARYHRIATYSPGVVYQMVRRLDGTLAFLFVSDASRQLYGIEPAALRADAGRLFARIPPDDLAYFRQVVAESAAHLVERKWQGRLRLDSGEEKWIENVFRPERQPGGEVLWDGVSLDVTIRIRTEEALRQAKEEAERANAAKSEFLSRMSHELRTPLNAILGFGQLLEISSLSAPQREATDHILKAGGHLLGLIDEVLDVARIEAGQLLLHPEPVLVGALLEEAAALVRTQAARRRVRLTAHGPADPAAPVPIHVWADRQRLKQVLINLLSNAVKYNREGGEVRFCCEPAAADRRVRIVVGDTGPGIAQEDLPRLFAPFDRLRAARSGIEGTGIGLSISKRLVEAMGGSLELAATSAAGSTFVVELAAAALPEPVPVPVSANGSARPAGPGSLPGTTTPRPPGPPTCQILYIEDNLANLQVVERLLAQRPTLRLVTAVRGERGLELAREQPPDLVLLDLHLPDLPGEEVLRRLRAGVIGTGVPVVVLSADVNPRQVQRALELGAWEYLAKPLNIAHFLRVVDDALEATARPEVLP